jgi:predicted ATP-grasp superfamily ATP-dependent carboligase
MGSRTVLVSEATRNPGLALIRILSRAGFDVAGADSQHLPLGLHSRYSPPYLGYQRKPESQLTESLLQVVKRVRPWVFQPLSTSAVQVVSKHRELFESLTNINVPPYDVFLTAMDKVRTFQICSRLGIPCPRLFEAGDAAKLFEADDTCGKTGKLVVKPRLDAGGAKGISYASDPKSLEEGIAKCQGLYGDTVLQEFIPGDVGATRLILLLFDRDGRLLTHLASRKIWQWPESGGQAALAASSKEPDLLRTILPFFEEVGWQGPAEVELKIDARDGLAKVIEINPRLPTYMGFPERCGVPLSTMLVRAAAGESLDSEVPDYKPDVRFMRTGAFLKVMLQRLRGGQGKVQIMRQAMAELRAGARPASWDFTDPLPRLGKLLLELTSLASPGNSRFASPED